MGPVEPHAAAPGARPPVQPARQPQPIRASVPDRSGAAGVADFQSVLDQVRVESAGLRLSAHARSRLAQRRIPLTEGHVQRLEDAVRRAASKGAREAVIMLDELAFVVSVKNRTVITVVDGPHLKENVFTNIDSVVFA